MRDIATSKVKVPTGSTFYSLRQLVTRFYFIQYFYFSGVPGEPLPVTSEEDIFDFIDMAYKKPTQRNA